MSRRVDPRDPFGLGRQAQAYFTPAELAARWRVTTRTLERWRVAETGPEWMMLHNRIRYPAEAVHTFEQARTRRPRP